MLTRWLGAVLVAGAGAILATKSVVDGIACDLDRDPLVVTLPLPLREVSGLAVTPDGWVLAHDDEQAVVYRILLDSGKVRPAFGLEGGRLRGDFEGIAAAGGNVWLITSDGILFEVPLGRGGGGGFVPYRRVDTGLGNQCEIEGLGWEPNGRVLLIACKTPRKQALEKQVTIFRWAVGAGHLATPSVIAVPFKDIPGHGGLHPSGIDRDPRSGHYFLVAAAEGKVLEITAAGDVLGLGDLKNRLHPQAEGIAFLPDGDLLISDEGQGKHRLATLARYGCR